MRGWRAALAALVLAPGAAKGCELALVLALDVSSSVDAAEYRLQQQGVAAALLDPEVTAAILAAGGVWLYSFEWSGRRQQVPHLGWTLLSDAAAIARAAARIAGAPRSHDDFPTALGYALGYAMIQHARAPATCRRRVIDVSGDGITNDGFKPRHAYAAHDMTGVTVNALVIEEGGGAVTAYFRGSVIRGPGAFLERAAGYRDYVRAMRRKLLREIALPGLAALDAPAGPD